MNTRRLLGVVVALGLCAPIDAQQPASWPTDTLKTKPKAKAESVTVVAGKQFERGGLYRWLFGENYRDVWTTPIRVPVLDLHTYADGLHPTKEGGGNQTKSLRLENAEGAGYVFRLSEKTVKTLPEQLDGTPIAGIIRDQVSSQHPGGAVMTAPIVEAVGILHPTPRLAVMADDSVLGKFREDFAGRLGMIEEYPSVPENKTGFGGASKIIDSDELLKLMNSNAAEHVDAPAFLAARLVDFVINDNDRHEGNWKWARLDGKSKDQWEPIARDRDHAFVTFEGAVLTLAGIMVPAVVKYTRAPDIPELAKPIAFNARVLSGLEKPVWDSVARSVQAHITDSVIDAATRALPAAWRSSAPRTVALLKARRDLIPKSADAFYHLLARRVVIHGSDSADHATITREKNGFVDVRLESKGKTFFKRRFDARETAELLVYLHDGNDTAAVAGAGDNSILVRVIGGNGTNTLVDSSSVGGRVHPTRLYDQGTVTGVTYGPDTMYDRRPWEKTDTLGPPLPDDGGSIAPVVGLSDHRNVGITPRIGFAKYSYGFGKRPYASMYAVDAEYATAYHAGRVSVEADHRLESSPLHFSVFGRMSDFESVNYHGLGNATAADSPIDRYYEVRQRQWLFRPTVGFAIGQSLDLSLGPVVQHASTDSLTNRFLSATRPYGFGTFNQAGLRFGARYAVRTLPDSEPVEHTHHRILIDAGAQYFPAMMDVRSAFEAADVTVATSMTLPVATHPLFVVRAGGKKVFGDAPFFEAATIGGEGTMRYMDTERYAGDAALYATTELRVPIVRFKLLMPLRAGILGLAEAGRVYVDGASPGGWHSRAGGGVWFGRGDASPVLTLTHTTEPGHGGVHLRLGLNF